MICSVQVALDGDQVKTLAFVSVVNFRIGNELSGIKLELKIEGITYTRLSCLNED